MKRIIGYVNTADLNHMRKEDVLALDVINIAFGLIRDGEVVWDAKDAKEGITSIHEIHPELKIVLSVGGWGADGFSQAARTQEGREKFAASALEIVKSSPFFKVPLVFYLSDLYDFIPESGLPLHRTVRFVFRPSRGLIRRPFSE